MKKIKISVKGKVQGVFFRSETNKKANKLGLNGWVKNEPDGTVTIMAAGDESQLKELIKWCAQNPGHSDVSNIEVTDLPGTETVHPGFSIKY